MASSHRLPPGCPKILIGAHCVWGTDRQEKTTVRAATGLHHECLECCFFNGITLIDNTHYTYTRLPTPFQTYLLLSSQ